MKDVPYIPVWELYQPAGWDKLKELLSNSRPGTSSFKRDMKPEPENRLFQLMEQGLRETVTHFNPKNIST